MCVSGLSTKRAHPAHTGGPQSDPVTSEDTQFIWSPVVSMMLSQSPKVGWRWTAVMSDDVISGTKELVERQTITFSHF